MEENNNIEITKKNPYIHDLRGPPQLPYEAIQDIVQSRGMKGARKILSDKYNVSEARIYKIWQEFYGGSTKAHFKSGIKKPLPNAQLPLDESQIRKIKTPRGTYKVKEPKTEVVNIRAKPIRKIQPTKQMDINDLDDVTNEEAEIMAGEALAGNQNSELLRAINELTISNHNLSEHAIKSLNK